MCFGEKEETSVFEASAEEYAAITKKYAAVYNTEVEEVRVTARSGDKITLPETVKASYSDGSTKNLGVIWNEEVLKSIDSSKPGTYEITGTVQQDAYAYPFIEERADPHVFYNEDDGYYYSTGSYYEENMTAPSCAQSYRKLDIRRAKTIEGLKTAEEHYILESKTGDRSGQASVCFSEQNRRSHLVVRICLLITAPSYIQYGFPLIQFCVRRLLFRFCCQEQCI